MADLGLEGVIYGEQLPDRVQANSTWADLERANRREVKGFGQRE